MSPGVGEGIRTRKSLALGERTRPIRPVERQPMKDWLLDQLDDDSVKHQLTWQDKNKREFRINWRHGSRHGWSIKDAELYKRWAQHTGRFNEKDQDSKRWKANFRCALNSLSDVEELKDSGIKKGANAFKVYKFKDQEKDKTKRVSRKRKNSSCTDESKAEKISATRQSDQSDTTCSSIASSPSYDSIGSPTSPSLPLSPPTHPSSTLRSYSIPQCSSSPINVEFGKMFTIPLHHCGFIMLKPEDVPGNGQRQRETFDTDSEPASTPHYAPVEEEEEEEEEEKNIIMDDMTEVVQQVDVSTEVDYHTDLWNDNLHISYSDTKPELDSIRNIISYERDITENLESL